MRRHTREDGVSDAGPDRAVNGPESVAKALFIAGFCVCCRKSEAVCTPHAIHLAWALMPAAVRANGESRVSNARE